MERGSGVNDVVRRHWDKAAFGRRAEERRRAEEEAERERERARDAARPNRDDPFAPSRPWLEGRKSNVDLESKVGKTEFVPGARDKRSGFYCEICESLHKDSQAYLNHINSRFHQKNLGMSMRVKRATVDDVKKRFQEVKEEAGKEKPEFDFRARVREREEEAERIKREKLEKKKLQKQSKRLEAQVEGEGREAGDEDGKGSDVVEAEDEMAQMAAMMGLPTGFSSSKKK